MPSCPAPRSRTSFNFPGARPGLAEPSGPVPVPVPRRAAMVASSARRAPQLGQKSGAPTRLEAHFGQTRVAGPPTGGGAASGPRAAGWAPDSFGFVSGTGSALFGLVSGTGSGAAAFAAGAAGVSAVVAGAAALAAAALAAAFSAASFCACSTAARAAAKPSNLGFGASAAGAGLAAAGAGPWTQAATSTASPQLVQVRAPGSWYVAQDWQTEPSSASNDAKKTLRWGGRISAGERAGQRRRRRALSIRGGLA